MAETRKGRTLVVMHRFALLGFLALAHCGGTVVPSEPAPTTTPSAEWKETVCTEVKASCTGKSALYVAGHATGLVGVDGGRAEFVIRYLHEGGMGLDVPHGVVVGRTTVKGGALDTCVCVPEGSSIYPQIAAVVFTPTTLGETGKEAARAMFSQRYATLGDEDLSFGLGAAPTEAQKEAAVAATVERSATVSISSLPEGVRIVAGLVADDRSIAPQLAGGATEGGKVAVQWNMPGRASSSEKIAYFVDQNGDGMCDIATDRGAIVPFAATIDGAPTLSGADLKPVCDALRTDASRE